MIRNVTLIWLCLLPIFISAQSTVDLAAFYPLSGNARDLSGNGINGTLNGPVEALDRFSYPGSALTFDGINDVIQVADDSRLRFGSDFTVMAWMNTNVEKTATVVRKNYDFGGGGLASYRLEIAGNQTLIFEILTSDGTFKVEKINYPTNQWILIAGRVTGNTMAIFVDGVKETEAMFTGNIQYDPGELLIGSRTQQFSNTFDGEIDDIKLFGRALSGTEIEDFFNQSCPDYFYLDGITAVDRTFSAKNLIEVENATINAGVMLGLQAPDVTLHPNVENLFSSQIDITVINDCP